MAAQAIDRAPLSHCGLGDLERLQGRYDEAVAHYSRAHELLQPVPMLIGAGYVVVRLETRLAGAFRRLRMRREEQRHAEAARLITARRQPYSFNWCWATSEAELHYDWAVYHAACADRNGTVSCLKRAIDFGWREVALLRVEPSFGVVGGERELESIVREAQQRAALPDYSPSDHSPRPARSPSVVGA